MTTQSFTKLKGLLRASSLFIVGNLNRDIKPGPISPGAYLFKDGETSVESIRETIGGGGANSACAAAALGAKVALAAKVGDDDLGVKLHKRLRKHGVLTYLSRDRRRPTGTSVNLVFEDSGRHFLSHLPNNAALAWQDLDPSALAGFDHLYRADVWFSDPMLDGGNEKLFRAARKAGLAISIDLNWDPRWGVASRKEVTARKGAVRKLLPWTDLAHGNVRELKEFADSPNLESALQRMERWGVKATVLHMGAEGVGYYCQGRLLVEPARRVLRPVNTTGCGDVLSVCMMLLHKFTEVPVRDQLRFANRIVADYMEGRLQLIPAL